MQFVEHQLRLKTELVHADFDEINVDAVRCLNFLHDVSSELIRFTALNDLERSAGSSLWFRLPTQGLKLLVLLEIRAMHFAPLNTAHRAR